jgi:endonuclease/exonuclease/phosphatase family metal-dependent hydrolase
MNPPPSSGAPAPGRTYPLRIATLNVWNPGPDKARRDRELAAMLRERNLDLVLLQELDGSSAQYEMYKKSAGFPHGLHADTLAILSRFELKDFDSPPLQRKPSLLPLNQLFKFRAIYFCAASFQYNGTLHRVSCHHWDNRKLVNRAMASVAISARLSQVPADQVILCGGDFNAGLESEELRRVTNEKLLDSGTPEGAPGSIDFILYRGSGIQVVGRTQETFPGLTDHPMPVREFSLPDNRPAVS